MDNQTRRNKMNNVTNKSKKYVTLQGYDYVKLSNTGVNFNFYPPSPIKVKKVIYNNPATIVYFTDGSKTVVKACEDDRFDEQTGLLMCIAKRFLGDDFHKVLKENVKDYDRPRVKITIGDFKKFIFHDFE